MNVERSEVGLYEVPMFLFDFRMGMMLTNFLVCGIMLVLRVIFVWDRTRSPRCLMLISSGPVELLIFLFDGFLDLWCGELHVVCCYVCLLFWLFYCVGELSIECICYLSSFWFAIVYVFCLWSRCLFGYFLQISQVSECYA